jgi:apolipoprotein N-acyltransferase
VVEEPFGSSIRVLSALVIVLLASIAFALQQINWTQKTGKPITVSVLQSNISQTDKLDRERTLSSSIKLYQSMTHKSRKSDLIVWPETGLFDAFSSHMDDVILPLQRSIRKKDQSILVGGFNINKNNEFENSVLAISKDSRQIYSKRHLVPFGEYIPLLNYIRWLGQWIELPYSNLAKGKNNGVLQVAGQTAQMTICYEDAFGSEIIQSLPEATMLINVTHDGWFTGSLEPDQHMQIARMRSLETGRYMVRATTTGPSGIIDEKGDVIATAPNYTKNIITAKVQPFTGATPYARWGNWLIVGILSVILLIALVGRKKN